VRRCGGGEDGRRLVAGVISQKKKLGKKEKGYLQEYRRFARKPRPKAAQEKFEKTLRKLWELW